MASKRVFATLGLALGLILAVPLTALAAGTLDQEVTSANNAHAVAGTLQPAQIFTAGLTGRMVQLDLQLSIGFGPGPEPGTLDDDLTVQIWTTAGGAPDSPISGASATVLRSAMAYGPPVWIHIPMNVPSVADTQYAIVLSSPGSSLGSCPDVCWQWLTDDNNPYDGGGSYYRYCCGSWIAQARDFDFKTYVLTGTDVQVYLSGSGEGANGTVTSSHVGIDCPTTCLANFKTGTQLTLTAHPASTAYFGSWVGGPCAGSHDPVCTFTLPAETVVTEAAFTGIPPTPVPTATPKPSPTPRPTATAAGSLAPSVGPSEPVESPADSGLASEQPSVATSLAPGATPGPTAGPFEPAAADGAPPLVVLLLVVIAALVAGGAGMYYVLRRRGAAHPPAV